MKEELRNKYPFVPEGDVLLELSSVFGEAKAAHRGKSGTPTKNWGRMKRKE